MDEAAVVPGASVLRSRRLIRQRAHEARALADDILKRLGSAGLGPGVEDFVRYRFEARLSWYGRRALSQNRYYTVIALTVIAAGLLSSGLTAFTESGDLTGAQRVLVIAFGVVVGVGTGLTQILRPAQRSVAYQEAYERLLIEGWQFVTERGRYKKAPDTAAAFALLTDAVLDVERSVARAHELSEPQQQA